MAISVEQVRDFLSKNGLVTPAETAAVLNGLSSDRTPDVNAFTTELVRQKKLTDYQAALLLQGKTKGLVFGEYTVLRQLGEGGMGVVLEAQHRYLKRMVALKVLHPSVTQSEDAVKRFHREVEAMARLSHPNIVAAFDANQQDGTYYFVMERVDGTDLSRLVKEQGLLSVEKAVDYILQAARGLEHAHQKGVVHRDIKPSNLVLDAEGRIKILDMGLVRFTDPQGNGATTEPEGLTQTGDIMGSFDYIAPEQAIDTKRADQRADVYSLGCTLHYLLVGKPPYSGDTSMQKLLAHRENAIPSLRKVRPDVPLALDAVFSRMVAKKAEDRYPSMTELIADLEAVNKARAATEATGHSTFTFAAPPPGPMPGRLIVVCGTACILAVLAANVFLGYEAAAHGWHIGEDVLLLKWLALVAGIVMVGVGILLSLVGGRRLAAGQRPQSRPGEVAWMVVRWFLGALAGLVVGGIAGAAIGGALAINPSDGVRLSGGTVVGVFAGAALGRRRGWLVIFGCGLAGYFVGSEVGKHPFSLDAYGIALRLAPTDVAMLGFGIVGAVVGAVLGAERRDFGSSKRSETQIKGPPAPAGKNEPAPVLGDAHVGKTVRRVHS